MRRTTRSPTSIHSRRTGIGKRGRGESEKGRWCVRGPWPWGKTKSHPVVNIVTVLLQACLRRSCCSSLCSAYRLASPPPPLVRSWPIPCIKAGDPSSASPCTVCSATPIAPTNQDVFCVSLATYHLHLIHPRGREMWIGSQTCPPVCQTRHTTIKAEQPAPPLRKCRSPTMYVSKPRWLERWSVAFTRSRWQADRQQYRAGCNAVNTPRRPPGAHSRSCPTHSRR